jgi:hypothetical protein
MFRFDNVSSFAFVFFFLKKKLSLYYVELINNVALMLFTTTGYEFNL